MELLQIVTSPVRFFDGRLQRPVDSRGALAPAACLFLLTLGSSSVLVWRVVEGVPLGITFFVAAVDGLAVVVWLSLVVGALVVLDAIFGKSARPRRVFEFAALALWTQVPMAVANWAFAALYAWPAEYVTTYSSFIDVLDFFETADMSALGAVSTLRLLDMYMGIWMAGLHGCILRIVSGFPVAGAVAGGVLMALVFAIFPWTLYW